MTRGELKEIIKECIQELEVEASHELVDETEIDEDLEFFNSVCEEYRMTEEEIMAEGSCEKILDEEFLLTEANDEEANKDSGFLKSMVDTVVKAIQTLSAKISKFLSDIKSNLYNKLDVEGKRKWEAVSRKLTEMKTSLKEMLGIAKKKDVNASELRSLEKELKENEKYVNKVSAAARKQEGFKSLSPREKKMYKQNHKARKAY